MKNKKILYISFIDETQQASGASQFRPRKMLEAFENLDCEIRTVKGITNNRSLRMKGCKEAREWLKDWRPDLCYVEPPSGPLFFHCDRALIKKVHKLGIPIGLFYRDAYWMFMKDIADEREQTSLVQEAKNKLIYFMQKHDLKIFKSCCDILYFPTTLMTESMGNVLDKSKTMLLPPGCNGKFEFENAQTNNDIPRGVFIGAATHRYGVPMLIKAADIVNRDGVKFNLDIICQQDSWNEFCQLYPDLSAEREWLSVHHLSAGPELEKLYAGCDFSIIPILKTAYNDFSFPVKLMDYLGHLLPIVSTNCRECEKFILENQIGLISQDDPESFAVELEKMSTDIQLRKQLRDNCIKTRETNNWQKRAEKVINDLSET